MQRRLNSVDGGMVAEARRHRSIPMVGLIALVGGVLLTACSSSSSSPATTASTSTTAAPATATLRILVTNDDGVGAPGINAAVQALRSIPRTQVTVVAPLTNQSGTGGRTTAGSLTVTAATTQSGYPAKAVHGYPADTIVWAIDDHGVAERPELVVSGINFGQNIGPLADLSGTVGAAKAALARGIPALAVSQGVDNGDSPNFALGAAQLVAWVDGHRTALIDRAAHAPLPEGNLNVPTCPGHVRGPVHVPQATSTTGLNLLTVDCTSTVTDPANDVEGFLEGFAVISPLTSAT